MAERGTASSAENADGFVPPFPYRWPHKLSPWQRLRIARQNLIAQFEEAAFDLDFTSVKVLTKRFFVCNSPETVQLAFGIKNEFVERKSPMMRHMLRPLMGDGLFISDGETWRKRRRIVTPIVHASRLAEFAPVMIESALAMGERWSQLPSSATIDALAEMATLTAEIICRSIFGREPRAEQARAVVEGFSKFQHAVSRIDLLSLFGLPDWVPRPRRIAVYRSAHRIHRVIDEIIAAHRDRAEGENATVVGRLIDAKDPETGWPLDATAVRNEAVVIFMAGHETTANTLAFAWYLLSQAPDVEARLHAELNTVLGARPPTLADVPKLEFTRAVVEETLRLYPPIPILAREAMATETVAGQHIPKGSIVMVIPWLLHRNRKLWDRPDHFLPERFLGTNGPAPDKWIYVPFSIGPRTCAGMAFGLTEAILCIATLAQRYSLRLAAGHEMQPICRVSLRPGDALPMTIHRRGTRSLPAASTSAPVAVAACPFSHG
jgi:cytochrome P450